MAYDDRFAVKAFVVISGYVGIFQKLHDNFQQVLHSIPGPFRGPAAGLLLGCESQSVCLFRGDTEQPVEVL